MNRHLEASVPLRLDLRVHLIWSLGGGGTSTDPRLYLPMGRALQRCGKELSPELRLGHSHCLRKGCQLLAKEVNVSILVSSSERNRVAFHLKFKRRRE